MSYITSVAQFKKSINDLYAYKLNERNYNFMKHQFTFPLKKVWQINDANLRYKCNAFNQMTLLKD